MIHVLWVSYVLAVFISSSQSLSFCRRCEADIQSQCRRCRWSQCLLHQSTCVFVVCLVPTQNFTYVNFDFDCEEVMVVAAHNLERLQFWLWRGHGCGSAQRGTAAVLSVKKLSLCRAWRGAGQTWRRGTSQTWRRWRRIHWRRCFVSCDDEWRQRSEQWWQMLQNLSGISRYGNPSC